MKYDVTITAKITKTYRVEADDEEEAIETAHQIFSVVAEEGIEENYDQDTVDCEEVTEKYDG